MDKERKPAHVDLKPTIAPGTTRTTDSRTADALERIAGTLDLYVRECRPALRAAAEVRWNSDDPPNCGCFSCLARRALAGMEEDHE